ncbi:MAG: Gfo/Idh/MocA family oxidoreductase, partial [Clostridiaceae bacterium]|nr:Gfo/Idh/MocA family oxidoreductase [Clostridiaceae bacterium]
RGYSLLSYVILEMDDIEVVAVCDKYEDRQKRAAESIEKSRGNTPICTDNYKEVIALNEVDAIIITASWADHIHIAIESMKAGKYTTIEVGGAYSIEECWSLVRAYEETKVPCMMLENCCYGRTELMVLNMVRQGLFGEVVHCEGGYHHDLRKEIAFGKENRHYRLVNYLNRNCENYPTHELGPIAKILDINRGNRMLSLTSTASKSAGLHQYIIDQKGSDYELASIHFEQGDAVTTVIKCAKGQTITLSLGTTLPRAYSRGFTIHGTKAMYMEDNNSLFIDGKHNDFENEWKQQWNNAEQYYEKYDHPLWKDYSKDIKEGHGGIDWLVFRAFFESVKNGAQTPIDVYDTVSWMCITALSEQSISLGSMPVAIPDFTNGKWINREKTAEGKYRLDRI